MQHLVAKPLQGKQKYNDGNRAGSYRTIDLPLWRDAYSCLDSVGFLQRDFCSPHGLYAASLLHGVEHCLGTLGVCAPVPVHVGVDDQCGWRKLPHAVIGLHSGALLNGLTLGGSMLLHAVLAMAPRLHVA